ncbi:antibiotic biosynthesis monooxygenase family protein [Streptomyces sp. NPDC056486]|uniref:antibiotic biosynthesis monooxygenase family protein n=1 Tax=Streptomyces sp. NPDC056486 TaxID=3345835 RepID=UPI0036A6266A
MSDQPVTPVQPFEPPYYTVVFTSVRTEAEDGHDDGYGDGHDDGYDETAARMEDLVSAVPGFLGIESARTPGGLGITVGYFRDEEAILRWRGDGEHRAAQQRGRGEWYEKYAVHVAKVERSYSFERSHGATESRSHAAAESRS